MSPIFSMVQFQAFGSSPPIKGITLSMKSRPETPGYPAPDKACIVTTLTALRPKLSARGLRAITHPNGRTIRISYDASLAKRLQFNKFKMIVINFGY